MGMPMEITVATLPVRLLARELRASHVDPSPVLAACSVNAEVIEEPGRQLPWGLCQALIDGFAHCDPRTDLGLRAGARAELGDLDLAGVYLRTHEQPAHAAAFHQQHRDVIDPSRWMDVYRREHAVVVAMPELPGLSCTSVLSDCLLSACLSLARLIMGPIEPVTVHLRRPAPAGTDAYREVFGPGVRFGCQLDAIALPLPAPDTSLPFGDATVAAGLRPHVERRLADIRAARGELVDGVSRAMEMAIHDGRPVTLQRVAKRVGISSRSLRRALQARGTSYMELLDRTRGDLARGYALETPVLSGPEIADRIGYADAHVLYRAFRRWTGQSLSEFRKQRFSAFG